VRILILSDSLPLPRVKPESCFYEDTWPELIRQANIIHQVSIGGATSSDLYRQCPYHVSFNPDVVIIQVGIVDCSPRFLTKTEQEVIKKIPVLGKELIRLMNKRWIRRTRSLTYTRIQLFKNNIQSMIQYFKNSRCIVIGILPSNSQYEHQLPGATKNINLYNKVLEEVGASFISLKDIPKHGVMTDHHHLNSVGHKYISDEILRILTPRKFS
jgi:lysophospholipase L1-like esterase